MRIERLKNLMDKLKKLEAKARADDGTSVIVGYTAAYALFVHENLEMKLRGVPRTNGKGMYWDPQGRGQSKFLEEPARALKDEYGKIVRDALKRGATLAQALVAAGLRLQRESMLLCPVDTGNLKASAFTKLEEGRS